MIKINEIFFSIQGESSRVGLPTVFVRTSGCPLRCAYCDTKYAYHDGKDMSIKEILQGIHQHPSRYICVTGGEPLAQTSIYKLMTHLCDLEYEVSLETSGQISCKKVDPRVTKIIDIKTPDSGAANTFCEENIECANKDTEFKFVICTEDDFRWSELFAQKNDLFSKSNVLYSPSYNCISEKWLAEQILENGSSARLQLQLHKYIWSPEARGV